jgi:hypothetical protein
MTEEENNTVDEVMRRCTVDASLLGPEDIDVLVDYYRKTQQQYDAGEKVPKRPSAKFDLDQPALTLASIGLQSAPKMNLRRPK